MQDAGGAFCLLYRAGTAHDHAGVERGVADKFGLHKKYVYLPNQFWKHKNHVVAVRAIERIKKRGLLADYDFVFTGNLEDYRNPEYINEAKSDHGD